MKISYDLLDYVGWSSEQFKDFHTKQLLQLIHQGRIYASQWDDWQIDSTEGRAELYKVRKVTEIVKVVLSTREHIPSKSEGKKLRQLAAKRK